MQQFLAERPQDKPFFAYLHFLDPHGEYEPPPEYLERFAQPHPDPIRLYGEDGVRFNVEALQAAGFGPGDARFDDMIARYDAEIAFVDDNVREIFDALAQHEEIDNTIALITADHGEEFLEHGYIEHAWQLYRESIHVPLILWGPGVIARERSAAPVSPEGMDGLPLLEETDGPWRAAAPENRTLYSELLIQVRSIQRAVTQGAMSYIAGQKWLTPAEMVEVARQHRELVEQHDNGVVPPLDVWGPVVHEELYDLRADPAQRQNLLPEAPEVENARELLEALKKRSVAPAEEKPQGEELTPEQIEQLRSIGYG
jgi:arylsulfatase A-like enzyme